MWTPACALQGGKATTEADKKALEEVELRVKLLGDLQEKFEDLGEPHAA